MENHTQHIHNFTQTDVPPTCTSSGYTSHRCACGYEHKSNFRPPVEHTFSPVEAVPANCTEGGSVKMVCSVCGKTEMKALQPLGHDCGDWFVYTHPRCTEDGKEICFCSRCGAVQERTVPATGHQCVPGTERKIKGGMVEFFCQHCGETVTQPKKQDKRKKKWILAAMSTVAVLALAVVTWLIVSATSSGYHYWLTKKYAQAGKNDKAYGHYVKMLELGIDEAQRKEFTVMSERIDTESIRYTDGEKTVTEHSFHIEYDGRGNPAVLYEYENGKMVGKTKYEYDENGNTILRTSFDENGDIGWKYEYEYDKNNNLILEIAYDENGDIWRKYEYEYDENNNQILEITYDEDGGMRWKYEYEYDENNNQILEITYDENGDIVGKNKYDKNNNGIHGREYGADGKLMYEVEYDSNGFQTYYASYDGEEGALTSETTYVYDDLLVFYTPEKAE